MADGALTALEAARAEAYSTPLDQIDVSQQDRFVANTLWPFFERLRNEAPVHWGVSPEFGGLLVGDQVRRHHRHRDQPPGLLVREEHLHRRQRRAAQW